MILLAHPYIYMQPLGNTFLYNVSILDLLKLELQSHRPHLATRVITFGGKRLDLIIYIIIDKACATLRSHI